MLLQGQTKSNEGFLGPMEKGFPLVSEGDGAVVRALRTDSEVLKEISKRTCEVDMGGVCS